MSNAHQQTYAVPALSQLTKFHGNNWKRENGVFSKITSRQLDDERSLDPATYHNLLNAWDVGRRISLVVPTQLSARKKHLQLTMRALAHQTFFKHRPRHSILEIIIVNDGQATPEDVFDVARYKHPLAEFRVFCLETRIGPARARNVGLYHSRGDIVFFLDCDMLLEPHLIAEHVIRHEYIPNLALLSFRSDITQQEADAVLKDADRGGALNLHARWKNDWKARGLKIAADSTLNGISLRKGKTVRLYNTTDRLRKWEGQFFGRGGHFDRDLPSVFATSCVSVRREHLMAVGGFRSHYDGWGIEDRDLGARLLGRGVRLVAVRSAGARHVKHKEAPREQKEGDTKANIRRYNSLMQEPYHERPQNLTKQIAQLNKEKTIYPELGFAYGTALPQMPRFQPRQSSLDLSLRTMLGQADSFLRRTIRGVTKTEGPVHPAEEDLKWRIMVEESPGGVLSVLSGINISDRREGSIHLNPGSGWLGFVVKHAKERLRRSAESDLTIARHPMAVDLTRSESWAVKITRHGLSRADREVIANWKFIIGIPIVIFLGWPGRSQYCMGAIAVHSAIDLDVARMLALQDAQVLSAVKRRGDKGILRAIDRANSSRECRLLRGILQDVAQCCGEFLVKFRTEIDNT